MKDVVKTATVDGTKIHLAYTVQALLDINRILKGDNGESRELANVILGDDPEDFETFTEIISVLNYCGERIRTSRGLKDGTVMSAERISAALLPKEHMKLKGIAMETILAGLGREENNSDVDLGLAELEKKNPRRRRR